MGEGSQLSNNQPKRREIRASANIMLHTHHLFKKASWSILFESVIYTQEYIKSEDDYQTEFIKWDSVIITNYLCISGGRKGFNLLQSIMNKIKVII